MTLVAGAPLLAGGPPGWVLYGILAVATVGVGAVALSRARDRSRDLADADVAQPCRNCPCRRTAVISQSAHPESARHIMDAQAAGHPRVLTINRAGASANRAASLAGIPKVPGKQLDEYPPAMFAEGGAGASVRAISPSDNMGAGASMGNQLRNAPDGCKITVVVGP